MKMKHIDKCTVAALLGTASFAMAAPSSGNNVESSSKVESRSESGGSKSSYQKQSVSVTSDGNKTTKKTVTVRDGKETVVTEITDADGKLISRTGGGDSGGTQEAGGPWLGVRVQPAQPALRDQLGLKDDEGVVVELLAADGPAAKAGIKINDILLKLDGANLSTPEDFRTELSKKQEGQTVTLNVLRKGVRKDITLALEKKPNEEAKSLSEDAHSPGGSTKEEIHLEVKGGSASAKATSSNNLDDVLKDPDVPDDFKKSVREMREKMSDFQRKHGMNGKEATE